MREIKFRAWDKRRQEMTHSLEICCYADGSTSVAGENGYGCTDDFLLMQFTGLKDCKGVEIYEGDIVLAKGIKSIGDYVTTIEWKDGSIVLARNDTYFVDSKAWLVCTVIGNLYENPELVEAPHNKAGSLG